MSTSEIGSGTAGEVREHLVLGITHVDLAWKRGRAEMAEMYEIAMIRLLDALEHVPDFKYPIEQAYHLRELAKRRPDLIRRLCRFIDEGRVEIVGAMASTLDTNLPNGECFVRNQQTGLRWVRENLGADVKTGWLVDTFGINAQVPQILKGFGLNQLIASRFGGSHTHDLFRAKGLDGSEVLVTGWGSYAGYIKPENLAWQFYRNWDHIDAAFRRSDALTGPGPYLTMLYTENEFLISLYPLEVMAERNRTQPHQRWRMVVPNEYFDAIRQSGRELPTVHGDLNPEFTGCYSLRHAIRLRNRAVETRLLEAEKWSALAGVPGGSPLEEAWWELAFIQFHDVFTGSHPTFVYQDVLRLFDTIESEANAVLRDAFSRLVPDSEPASDARSQIVPLFNGLPWERRDLVEIPVPSGWEGVRAVRDLNGDLVPFEVEGGTVRATVTVPTTGQAGATLEAGNSPAPVWEDADSTILENDWLRLELDTTSGIARLVEKTTGTFLLDGAKTWLVAQRDEGNFQIESPRSAEVAAMSGTVRLQTRPSPLGTVARLSGSFPTLYWAGPEHHLHWEADFFVPTERHEVRLSLRMDWKGESTRLRLTLPTVVDTAYGIYEIPFGTVRRGSYTPRENAKGEWPAHRFVALENNGVGVALVNTGVGGVEVSGGTLYTTLLRAPKAEYAGMVADETSSQHGEHAYEFSLVPYPGTWADGPLLRLAQERNNPLLPGPPSAGDAAITPHSYLTLEAQTVILSSLHAAPDGSGQLVARLYETAGRESTATLTAAGLHAAYASDVQEGLGPELPVEGESLSLTFRPFEIRTVRLERRP